ncbi:MAG: hypothetical protein R3B84_04320 [Zavarzinella sp.]
MFLAAISFAVLLAGLAIVSLRYQFRNFLKYRRGVLASTDRSYLRGQFFRRTTNAFFMLALAGLLVWSFSSGKHQHFEEIAQMKEKAPNSEMSENDKLFLKNYVMYWIVVLGVLLMVLLLAIVDYFAVSLYGRQEIRRIQREQRSLLERDLAMVRTQQINNRMKGGSAQ